ncbi:MAG: RNA-binding protein [Spirochaetes bacterium]|nr:RNA-binding protein [Spirochaetota bacterium]
MSKKIYVGNLNYTTTEDELQNLFSQYGAVTSTNIVMDRYTNQSKGFGFVEMEADDAAEAAISALNGQDYNGRGLRVNEAKPRKPRNNNYRY